MWNILGIEPTTDLNIIKAAYKELLKTYHPEDDPEGYQRLRKAFDDARKYVKNNKNKTQSIKEEYELDSKLKDENTYNNAAYTNEHYNEGTNEDNNNENLEEELEANTETNTEKTSSFNLFSDIVDEIGSFNNNDSSLESEEQTDEQTSNQKDDDLVNSFIEDVKNLYNDYNKRINLFNWKKLFDTSLFIDLDLKIKINKELIKFLFECHYFPKEIWTYLDSIFEWSSYDTSLYDDVDPKHFAFIAYGKLNEDPHGVFEYNIDTDDDNFDYETFIMYRTLSFQGLLLNGLNSPEIYLPLAYDLNKKDRILLRIYCEYLKRIGNTSLGLKISRSYIELHSKDINSYMYHAYFCYEEGCYAEALNSCDILIKISTNSDYILLKSKCCLELKDYEYAYYLIKRAVDDDPSDFEANLLSDVVTPLYIKHLKSKNNSSDRKKARKLKSELYKNESVISVVFRNSITIIWNIIKLILLSPLYLFIRAPKIIKSIIVAGVLISLIAHGFNSSSDEPSQEVDKSEKPTIETVDESTEKPQKEVYFVKTLIGKDWVYFLNTVMTFKPDVFYGDPSLKDKPNISAYLFCYKIRGKNFLLILSPEEKAKYDDDTNIFYYTNKNIVPSRKSIAAIVNSVNTNTKFTLNVNNTFFFEEKNEVLNNE